jgi:hypothetical protein
MSCAVKHNDHDFIDIDDEALVPKITNEMLDYYAALNSDYEQVQQLTADLTACLESLSKEREENVEEIEEFFAELHRRLDMRKVELIETIHEEVDLKTERVTEELKEAEKAMKLHGKVTEELKSFLEEYETCNRADKIEASYQLYYHFKRLKPLSFSIPVNWSSYFAHDSNAFHEISSIGRIVSRVNKLPSQKVVYFCKDYCSKVWRCNLELQAIDEVRGVTLPKFSSFNSVYVDPQDAYYIFGFSADDKHFLKLFEEGVTVESTDMPFLNWNCAAWCGNYLYVMGGEKDHVSHDECHKYNLNTKRWEEMPRMIVPRDLAAACGFNSFVMVFGGYTNQFLHSTIERFDTKKSRWSVLHVRLPLPLACMGLFSSDRGILIFGGETSKGDTDAVHWWDGAGLMTECTGLPVKILMDCTSMSACYDSQLYIIRDEGEAAFFYYTFPLEKL